jgi:hypothetical protein
MIAVIETSASGEGNRHVMGANIIMVLLYCIGAAGLAKTLYRIVGVAGFDESAVGVSWVMAVVFGLGALHGAAAYGASRKRHWSRTLSRVLVFVLFPVIPFGTAFSLFVLRNTRPGRWVSVTNGS